MKIAAIVNVHGNRECAEDTIDSMRPFFGDHVLLLIEGATWEKWGKTFKSDSCRMKGLVHNCPRSPYRNVALGISKAWEKWHDDMEWLCYCEPDVLFASDRFITNLEMASSRNVWMLGNDGHVDDKKMPLVEAMLGTEFVSTYYLLGCCQFFHREFLLKLEEIDFFNRFLFLTNGFAAGYFPGYSGHDISEHLYPTLCRHFGGAIGVFATWDGVRWHGAHQYFPLRWRPELDTQTENFTDASVLHPLKSADHPLRIFHRKKRQDVHHH